MHEHELAADVHRIAAGDVELAYQTFGDPADPPLLLVMGLATQMLGWPDPFCDALAERGFHVIRFDNRDVGLSTHLDDHPVADIGAIMHGDRSTVAYLLGDMARDTAALLDALGIDRAHVVGASMGGMIAQALAIEHPEKVRSLTSIMSTTGDLSVGGATDAALGVLFAPPATNRDEAIERSVSTFRVIGSPGFEYDEAAVRDRAARSFDRGYDPAGVSRQLAAVMASGDRTQRLRELSVPTLVIHGAQDPLLRVSGGQATAGAIPGAQLVVIEGMGHDLPRDLWEELADRIAAHLSGAEAA